MQIRHVSALKYLHHRVGIDHRFDVSIHVETTYLGIEWSKHCSVKRIKT